MKIAFLDKDRKLIVQEIVLAGPGPMKDQLQQHMPAEFGNMVTRVINLNRSGKPGIYDLTQILNGVQVTTTADKTQAKKDKQDVQVTAKADKTQAEEDKPDEVTTKVGKRDKRRAKKHKQSMEVIIESYKTEAEEDQQHFRIEED